MIAVTMNYRILPTTDLLAYETVMRRAVGLALNATGIEEISAHRDLLNPAHVMTTSTWDSPGEWAAFVERPEWQAVVGEMRRHVEDLRIDVWGPSPVIPEPLHPKR
jgi:heme-degrading monooxygenase HmoA